MNLRAVYKITTYVPPHFIESVIAGITGVVPLTYCAYDSVVWYSSPGVEQFRPLSGSNPTQGDIGEVEKGDSIRLEFSIPRDRDLLQDVLTKGILKSHPWEEPVIYVHECLSTRTQVDESV